MKSYLSSLMNVNQLILMFGIAVSIVLLGSASAFAVDAESATERITLTPSSTTLKLDAGQMTRGSMKVKNDGDVPFGFSVYARPYGVSNELYEPNFTDQKSNTDIYKWVQFDQTKYQLNPGESVDVLYTIRIPADAKPGGHYGVLFAETDERGLQGTGVARKKRVGNLLYATVDGTYKTSGTFKEFILPFWQTRPPMASSARVENTGNVDFRAKVNTTAKDLFGRTKFSYTGDPIVLPNTTRLIEMKWEAAPSFGIFKVNQTVTFLDQKQENNGYVLIAPKWALVVVIILVSAGAAYAVLQRRNSRR